jgi:hypothetical protein
MGALFDKYMALWEECLKEMNRIDDFGVRKNKTDPEGTAPPASPFP